MPNLFLGETVDAAAHKRSGTQVLLDSANLTTHGVIVGQTGSGKTGLGMVLIEETLRAGIPALLIDPKGDLGNLLLTFPELRTEDFSPWVEGADAAQVAQQWKDGLAGWGLDGTTVAELKQKAGFTIYTPGSNAGVGLNLVGSLQPPAGAADDPEGRIDEVGTVVSGLLGLLGIDSDPLSGREHILLTNLIDRCWANGESLDLPTLVAQIQQPPIRKLGVLDIDAFYPAKDRTELAMKFNGLLASPAFAAWAEGVPMDIQSMLFLPDGRPRAAIVTLGHLSDEERQFAVSVLLGRLISWMRKQPGTSQLRALVYFDEVFGFVPPTAMPPTKKPILTLLKQARAFGIGLVLATQNPVDVDYKAISNAATWIIGRLQTERDQARLLDGMKSAAGGVDMDQLSATISGLAKREFVLHRAGVTKPEVFTSRWSLSYLRGPLTRQQISALMAEQKTAIAAGAAGGSSGAAPSASATAAANAAATSNEVPVAPAVAKGVPAYFLDPGAPWAREAGLDTRSKRFEPAIVARVMCMFDDAKKGVRDQDEWEAFFWPLQRTFDPTSAKVVDYDVRDLVTEAPVGATFVLPDIPLTDANYFKSGQKLLADYLVANHTLPLFQNPQLKLFSRQDESEDDFLRRCDDAAQVKADEEAAKLREKTDARVKKLEAEIHDAERDAVEAEAEKKSKRNRALLGAATGILGSLLGGRKSTRSIARSIGSAASSGGGRAGAKQETAEQRMERGEAELNQIEEELKTELFEIDAKWDQVGKAIEPVPVTLAKADITVTEFALVWVPTEG